MYFSWIVLVPSCEGIMHEYGMTLISTPMPGWRTKYIFLLYDIEKENSIKPKVGFSLFIKTIYNDLFSQVPLLQVNTTKGNVTLFKKRTFKDKQQTCSLNEWGPSCKAPLICWFNKAYNNTWRVSLQIKVSRPHTSVSMLHMSNSSVEHVVMIKLTFYTFI